MDKNKLQFGEAFSIWWSKANEGRDKESEELARLAWDGAVQKAAEILQDEVDRLVAAQNYEWAAQARDDREHIESVFTKAAVWDWLEYKNHKRKSLP